MSGVAYNKDNIVQALRNVGLQEGDTAYFSTSLGMIGLPEGVENLQGLNSMFFDAIINVLGKTGTVLIPAYSYTFGQETGGEGLQTFDPKSTPANVGPFPDFFLKQKNVIRSLDPMVSMAGLGPHAHALFKDLPPTSYGQDSLFARLVAHPATKCVSLGIGPNWIPFLHHADWLAQVPFRYDKLFYGKIRDKTALRQVCWVYSVRALINESIADAHRLGEMATDSGIWSHTPLGRARIYACHYKKLFDFTMKHLKQNKWITAKGPPCNVLEKSQIAIGEGSRKKGTATSKPGLRDLPRDIMGDGIAKILVEIAKRHPIRICKFATGTNVFDWVVPEKEITSGKQLIMAEMHVGEWVLKGKRKQSVLLCCYLDAHTDCQLYGLMSGLAILQKLQRHGSLNLTYRLAILPGTIGYAAYLTNTKQKDILGAFHLTEADSYAPVSYTHLTLPTKREL